MTHEPAGPPGPLPSLPPVEEPQEPQDGMPHPAEEPPALAPYGRWPVILGLLLGVVILSSLLALPILLIFALGSQGAVLENPFTLFMVILIEDAVFLGVIYFVFIYRGVTSWKDMGLGGISRRALGQGLLWGVSFVAVSTLLELLLAALGVDQTQAAQFPIGRAGGVAGVVAIWIAGVIFAPFTEEVFFRGYVFRALSLRKGWVKGVVYSSLVFGAVHLNLAAFLPITVGAAMLALGYRRSGDLWVPIIGHAFNNAVAFTLLTISLYA